MAARKLKALHFNPKALSVIRGGVVNYLIKLQPLVHHYFDGFAFSPVELWKGSAELGGNCISDISIARDAGH